VCHILLQAFLPVLAFRQQSKTQQEPAWPPGGWPPPPPPGPLQSGDVPTLEPQPHKPQDVDIEDHWHPKVYRKFATRFEPKPVDHAYLLHPENRYAYEEFHEDHPRHPAYPNSVDRSAESLVILIFALVGLAIVFFVVIVVDRLQARHISSKNVKFGAMALVFAPWILLWTWVLLVIVSNFDEPTRGHGDQFHWACPLMLVYLGVFLVIHTVNVVVQAYAEWHTIFAKKEGKMGQMFKAIDAAEAKHPTWVKPVRQTFFALDVLIMLFGVWLMFFSGPHRDFCQPQLWWTSAAISSVTAAAFLAAAAVYGCWRCVGALAARSSGRDALAFFHVLYHGEKVDSGPTFMPASDPVVETKPFQPQTSPQLPRASISTSTPVMAKKSPTMLPMTTQHVARELHHAASSPNVAKPHRDRPKLQHARTVTSGLGEGGLAGDWTPTTQSMGRI